MLCSDASWVTNPGPGAERFAGLEDLHIVRFWGADWGPASDALARRFAERHGSPPDHAEALTYDPFMLVAAAVRGRAASLFAPPRTWE